MSTERETITLTKATIVGFILRVVLLVAVLLSMGYGQGGREAGAAEMGAAGVDAAPVLPLDCAPGEGDLFNPCATLDTTQVDDLRGSAESRCMTAGGVVLADGRCVAGALVWADEVDSATVARLLDNGLTWVIGGDSPDGVPALLVPAEWVILGGPDGEELLRLDMHRDVTVLVA